MSVEAVVVGDGWIDVRTRRKLRSLGAFGGRPHGWRSGRDNDRLDQLSTVAAYRKRGPLLVAGSRETAFRVEAMTSRLVHVAVVDVIFVMLAMRKEPSSTETRQRGRERASSLIA